jgi:hypothetical protein
VSFGARFRARLSLIRRSTDGIEIRFMNNDGNHLRNVTDVSTVREAFDEIVPFGSTPTGMALDEILRA